MNDPVIKDLLAKQIRTDSSEFYDYLSKAELIEEKSFEEKLILKD